MGYWDCISVPRHGVMLQAPFKNSPLAPGSLNCILPAPWQNFKCSLNSIVFLLPGSVLPCFLSPMLPAPWLIEPHSPGSLKPHVGAHQWIAWPKSPWESLFWSTRSSNRTNFPSYFLLDRQNFMRVCLSCWNFIWRKSANTFLGFLSKNKSENGQLKVNCANKDQNTLRLLRMIQTVYTDREQN